jgi:hypothetical protein
MTTTRFRGGEYLGVRIPTIFDENNAIRCSGCGEVIPGQPFRVTILDIAPMEIATPWASRAPVNPGPHQFHANADHVRAWLRRKEILLCRVSDVRELMRPVPIPGETARWGVCDGLHREAHEFVPA